VAGYRGGLQCVITELYTKINKMLLTLRRTQTWHVTKEKFKTHLSVSFNHEHNPLRRCGWCRDFDAVHTQPYPYKRITYLFSLSNVFHTSSKCAVLKTNNRSFINNSAIKKIKRKITDRLNFHGLMKSGFELYDSASQWIHDLFIYSLIKTQ